MITQKNLFYAKVWFYPCAAHILDDDIFFVATATSVMQRAAALTPTLMKTADLGPRAQRVCGDENSKAGGSVDENVVCGDI